MRKIFSEHRQKWLGLILFAVVLSCLFVAGLLVQGLLIMRQDVRDHPLTWTPNAMGALMTLGLACSAFAGCLAWWNAPEGTNRIDNFPKASLKLFTAGKWLTKAAFCGVVATFAFSHMG